MYKTAKELGITTGERKWLLKTAKLLATMSPEDARKIDGVNMGFDLSMWFTTRRAHDKLLIGKTTLCGTMGCIKGWMGTLAFAADCALDLGVKLKGKRAMPSEFVDSAHPPMVSWDHSRRLYPLFTPEYIGEYSQVTPKDAANTIIRFLETGLVQYPMKYFSSSSSKRAELERRKFERKDMLARRKALA